MCACCCRSCIELQWSVGVWELRAALCDIFHTPMARFSLFVQKVPLNTNVTNFACFQIMTYQWQIWFLAHCVRVAHQDEWWGLLDVIQRMHIWPCAQGHMCHVESGICLVHGRNMPRWHPMVPPRTPKGEFFGWKFTALATEPWMLLDRVIKIRTRQNAKRGGSVGRHAIDQF